MVDIHTGHVPDGDALFADAIALDRDYTGYKDVVKIILQHCLGKRESKQLGRGTMDKW